MSKIIYFHTKEDQIREIKNKMCKKEINQIRSDEDLRENVSQCANLILNTFDIDFSSGGVPIVKILNSLGIKTYQKEMTPRELSAYISINPAYIEKYGTSKIACVNSLDNFGHKRFALAHELAHYIFDYDERKSLIYNNTYIASENMDDEIERRANTFAANLLMPEEEFKKEEKRINKEVNGSKIETLEIIAKNFGVSPSAALKRMREVGIEGYSLSLDN